MSLVLPPQRLHGALWATTTDTSRPLSSNCLAFIPHISPGLSGVAALITCETSNLVLGSDTLAKPQLMDETFAEQCNIGSFSRALNEMIPERVRCPQWHLQQQIRKRKIASFAAFFSNISDILLFWRITIVWKCRLNVSLITACCSTSRDLGWAHLPECSIIMPTLKGRFKGPQRVHCMSEPCIIHSIIRQ